MNSNIEGNMKKIPRVKQSKIMFKKKMHKDLMGYLAELQKKYGDIFCKSFLGRDNYYLCHPKHVEHVLYSRQENYRKDYLFNQIFEPFIGVDNLLTNNNLKEWHHDRELAKLSFESELFFERYTDTIVNESQLMLNNWRDQLTSQSSNIPIQLEMDKLTLKIVTNTIFHDVDLNVDFLAPLVPKIFKMMSKKTYAVTQLPWILPTKTRNDYREMVKLVEQIASKIVTDRLALNWDYDDLLGSFLYDYHVLGKHDKNFIHVCHNIMFFNIVGYFTTTSALCWAFALLAKHPEIETKISQEVKEVCNGNSPTYADFKKLKYTQAVIAEVLRLYPPVVRIMRQAIAADEVMGYGISEGSSMYLNAYLIHRHPDYWENPDEFNPERFLKYPWGQDYQYAYIPFGAGKRSCLGKNFAFLELCLIVAMISQSFTLKFASENDERNLKIDYSTFIIRPNVSEMQLQKKS